jgi:glycosyltransferase involved in cell wall biosynthesis
MPAMDRTRARYIWSITKQGPTEFGYALFRARRRRKGRGDQDMLSEGDRLALSGLFDIQPGDLERNAEVVESYAGLPELDIRTIQWFLPHFDHPYFAGVHTILRFADHFRRVHGVESRFCIFDAPRVRAHERISQLIAQAFPALADAPVTQWGNDRRDPFGHLPPCDAAIATLWSSAYHVMRFDRCRAKFFFVQDFEPAFYAAGSGWALAEETWRFGLPGIVNTPGLGEVYRGYGNPAISFVPAVDTDRYRPDGPRPSERGGPLRVFFYGRPGQPRNAFGLGLATLAKVKEHFGDRVEIVAAGGRWQPGAFGVLGRIENLGILPDLDAVAELYRSCDAGLVFMLTKHPSYQPLEFMASGMATVTNANPATEWLLRHEENALVAPPAASLVAEQIVRVLEDEPLRRRLTATALAEVRGTTWEAQLERVWGAMTKRGEAFETVAGELTGAPRSTAPGA